MKYELRLKMKYFWMGMIWLCLPVVIWAQDEPYTIVDEMPYYSTDCGTWDATSQERKSCSDSTLYHYISSEIVYPDSAMAAGIQGTVVVRFVVDKTGAVKDAEVVRDIGGNCGEEALRVVETLDQWEAGKKDGKAVDVQMHLPIRFKMREIPLTIRSEKFEYLRDLFCVNYLTDFAKKEMVRQMADDTLNPENVCEVDNLPNAISNLKFSIKRTDGTSSTVDSADGSISPSMRGFLKNATVGDVIELEFDLTVTTTHPETGEPQDIQKEMYRSIIIEE